MDNELSIQDSTNVDDTNATTIDEKDVSFGKDVTTPSHAENLDDTLDQQSQDYYNPLSLLQELQSLSNETMDEVKGNNTDNEDHIAEQPEQEPVEDEDEVETEEIKVDVAEDNDYYDPSSLLLELLSLSNEDDENKKIDTKDY